MKYLFLILCFLAQTSLFSQRIGLRLGRNLNPASYLSLRYEHWTNSGINLTGAFSYENSRADHLRYHCFSFDLLGEYASNSNAVTEHLLGWRFGLGTTVQHETEPWLFRNKSFAQRLNYGLAGETSLECYLTDNFRLNLFGQQKYMVRPGMRSLRFAFGIGLTCNLAGL